MKDKGQTSSKNGFWDVKIRFLQNACQYPQMTWGVFGGVSWVPRHVNHDIRPYENDSKKFLKTTKFSMRSRFCYICLYEALKKRIFPHFEANTKPKGSFGFDL